MDRNSNSILALGIMSGTSLDGLDLCLAQFDHDENWRYRIVQTHCVPYEPIWQEKLGSAHLLPEGHLQRLHISFGQFIAEQANRFLCHYNLPKPDLVCSHGHTVFHQPEKGITLQIGDGATIATHTGITCINDFRSLDVSLGGQGAPLVPIGDELLFPEYEACLNLGGFSNISFKESGVRKAFDICPVNIVLNELASRLGQPFDRDGMYSRSGELNEVLLDRLNHLDLYLSQTRPSLAREWVEKAVLPILDNTEWPTTDLMRTFVEHVAIQIARVIEQRVAGGRVLVTGGGTYNRFLMERMHSYCLADLIVPEKDIIAYKEALIFAFLGVLRIRNEINVLRSVTGAANDSCSGEVHWPMVT